MMLIEWSWKQNIRIFWKCVTSVVYLSNILNVYKNMFKNDSWVLLNLFSIGFLIDMEVASCVFVFFLYREETWLIFATIQKTNIPADFLKTLNILKYLRFWTDKLNIPKWDTCYFHLYSCQIHLKNLQNFYFLVI